MAQSQTSQNATTDPNAGWSCGGGTCPDLISPASSSSSTVNFMAAQNAGIVWPAIFAGRAYQSAFNGTFNVLSNTTKFGRVIPDLVGNGVLELKAGQYVYNSSQILGEMELATETEVPYFLVVSPQSTIASTTLNSISNLPYGGQALVFDAEAGTVAAYEEGSGVSAAFWEMIAAAMIEE
jgi:hypothetical protein